MRVLLVIDRLGSGGAQTQIVLLARGLVEEGHEVTLLTYHENDLLDFAAALTGVRLVSVDQGKLGKIKVIARVARELRSADAAISFLAVPSFCLTISAALTRFSGPVIAGERASFRGVKPSLRDRLLRMPLVFATDVVCNSAAHCREMLRYFPSLNGKISCIRNGVDFDRFSKLAPVARSGVRIVAIGRVVPEKGIETLVRGVQLYIRQTGTADVTVKWYGKIHNQECYESALESINRLLPSAVWEWAGEVSDISVALASADVLVHSSSHEGCPNAVCEALAAGLPCVVSRFGDADYLVGAESERGATIPIGDPKALARALQGIFNLSVEQRAVMRDECLRFARSELSCGRMVNEYLSLLERRAA